MVARTLLRRGRPWASASARTVEACSHLVDGLPARGDDGGVSEDQGEIGLDRLVPRVHLAERPAEAVYGVVDLCEGLDLRDRMPGPQCAEQARKSARSSGKCA